MDFSDPWFSQQRPTEWHELLIKWVPLVTMDGRPKGGGSRMPQFGEKGCFDVVYMAIGGALNAVKLEHLTSLASEEAQKNINRLATVASQQTDQAAAAGAALAALDELYAGKPYSIQLDRNTKMYIVNKSWHGLTFADALMSFYEAMKARQKK